MPNTLGDTIRTMRIRAQMGPTKLARTAGIARSTLHYIETNQQPPTLDTLYSLATALNCDLVIQFKRKANHE